MWRRIFYWWRRDLEDQDLNEELRADISIGAREGREAGRDPEDAGIAARRALGSLTRVAEETRETWAWTWLTQLSQDLRYALRAMRHNRVFTALAVLSLALGIGANAALFSFMDAILLRSLPVTDPESLVLFKWRGPNSGARGTWDSAGTSQPATLTEGAFPQPVLDLFAQREDLVSAVFAYMGGSQANVVVDGVADLTETVYVSRDYFRGLGIRPAYGRLLAAEDAQPGTTPSAVVSLAFARARFGDPASAVGASMRVDGLDCRIVGIAPAGFFGVNPAWNPDLYLPLHAEPGATVGGRRSATDASQYWLETMARLRPGVTRAEVQGQLEPLFQRMAGDATREGRVRRIPQLLVLDGARGLDSLRIRYSQPLWLLMAMSALILAIACANLANLLLARAASRTKEMAVRLSIGAGRWRVVRQLLTESVLVSALGAALGLGLAAWGIRVLTVLLGNGEDHYTLRADLNWHVLAAAAGLALLTGLVFGLAPALLSTRIDVMPALKQIRSSTHAPGSRTRWFPNLGQTLMVAQIAFSLLMLVAAGLFGRTLASLNGVDLGFNGENLLLVQVKAEQGGYQGDALYGFYGDLHQRIQALPGVRSASLSLFPHVAGGGLSFGVRVPDSSTPEGDAGFLPIGPGYFETLQIPLVAGRAIEASDGPGAPLVAVVNEQFARRHFGALSAIGRTFRYDKDPVEIVGVVRDAFYSSVKEDIQPMIYVPYGQNRFLQTMTYALRTGGDPGALSSLVRDTVRQMNPLVPVPHILTQREEIARQFNQEIVFARLSGAFAALALLIACVGLYATMSYRVTQRTPEIGIRIALGAGRARIIRLSLRQAIAMLAGGVAAGLPVALGFTKLVESFLWGVEPNDPATMAGAVVVLAMSALLAGYIPARRAARVHPMTALRHE